MVSDSLLPEDDPHNYLKELEKPRVEESHEEEKKDSIIGEPQE
jgi:hypothetical protein